MLLRKFIFFIFLIYVPNFLLYAKPIKVGIIAGPSVQIINVAKKIAKEKYNIEIEPVVFTNYQIPNEALNSGDIDVNIMQTVSYLNQSIAKRKYKITSIGKTFIYPMGIYSKKIKNLQELKEKSTIAIPNDLSNEGRALLLLSKNKLVKLKAGTAEFANINDIIENPKNLKIVTLDAAQLARVVSDVDAVALNNDFVNNAGFKTSDAIVAENAATAQPYINVIVVKISDKDREEYKKIVDVMHSKEVYDKSLELYPGAVKAW